MRALVLLSALLLCAVDIAFSQRIPLCRQLRRNARDEGPTLFKIDLSVNVSRSLEERDCITRRGRVRVFYSCGDGFSPVLSGGDDNNVASSFIDLTRTGQTVECVPRPPTAPPTSDPAETTEEIPTTQLAACPRSGPTQLANFLSSTVRAELVCLSECIFKIRVFGSVSERKRTIYTCCYGEAKQFSIALPGVYTCPKRP